MDLKDEKAKNLIDAAQQGAPIGKPQITAEMLKNSPNIVCECGGMIFSEKLFFKKISPIISPSGKPEVAPMPIMVCENCGKVPGVFDSQNILPVEIKATKWVQEPTEEYKSTLPDGSGPENKK